MKKLFFIGLASAVLSVLFAAEANYQRALRYTQDVAFTDAEIVEAMRKYGFELDGTYDDINILTQLKALINKP